MKKTTLQDMRDILVDSKEGSDRHFWGVVTRQNKTESGDVTSYEVALGGDEGTMTCRKLAGANVGDTVMVTLTKTGMAVVTGTVDGDKDAEAAMTTAEAAQGAVDTLSETVDTLSDDVDSIEGLVGDGEETGITITTQYYLSTSNTTQTGGTWSDTLPAYVEGRYYWMKTITTYADGSEVESTPVLDVAAQISAETNAVATATDQHFWSDSSGAYVTKSNKNLSSGYAMKITTNGLMQTYNNKNLMSLTSSGLSFYQSDGSTLLASYSSAGAYMYASGSVAASFTSSGVNLYSGSSLAASFTSSGVDLYSGTTRAASFTSTGVTLYSGGSIRFIVGNLAAVFNVLTYFDQQPSFKSSALPFSVSSHSFTIPAISTSGGSTGAQTVTLSKSGYYPIAIAGFQTGGSNLVFARIDLTSSSLSSATITYNARAIGTTTSASSASVRILWAKAHSVSPSP